VKPVLDQKIRILLGSKIAMGPGKADLLEAIEQTESISAAAKKMRMSYRRAWMLVDAMNTSFKNPLVITAKGGKSGGGASVTELGMDVLKRYRKIQKAATAVIAKDVNELSKLVSSRTKS
jgi:molybdate transport system regulatory protein